MNQRYGVQATVKISAICFSVFKITFDRVYIFYLLSCSSYITCIWSLSIHAYRDEYIYRYKFDYSKRTLTVRESPTAATTLISAGLSSCTAQRMMSLSLVELNFPQYISIIRAKNIYFTWGGRSGRWASVRARYLSAQKLQSNSSFNSTACCVIL